MNPVIKASTKGGEIIKKGLLIGMIGLCTVLGGSIIYGGSVEGTTEATIAIAVPEKKERPKAKKPEDAIKKGTKTVLGKKIEYVTIDMKYSNIQPKVVFANNIVNKAISLEKMTQMNKGFASINGSYFAAYNKQPPMPYGVIIKGGKPIHLSLQGSVVGFTKEGKVLIDVVEVLPQGYRNGEYEWTSYYMNRPTGGADSVVIYTPEYSGNIILDKDWVQVVCQKGKVVSKSKKATAVPKDGFILTMTEERSARFAIGDSVYYEISYGPKNTSPEEWAEVVEAVGAGPSLIINGKPSGNPKEERFSENKIIRDAALRSFIGVNKNNQVFIGTTTATIADLKKIAKELQLTSAMCLDGGGSSALYYNGKYMTRPGRNINNSVQFIFKQ